MKNEDKNLLRALLDGELPDESGRFGSFGGQYAPETLMPALKKLEKNINSQRACRIFSTAVKPCLIRKFKLDCLHEAFIFFLYF